MLDVPPQLPLWSDDDPSESWVVRESRRARRLAVRVFQTGRVEVVVPPRTSRMAVERFLAHHRGWIERKRAEARRNVLVGEPFPPRLIELAACGESWRVHLAGGTGRPQLANSPGLLSLHGDCRNTRAVRQLLRGWLIGHARVVLAARLAECARELGFAYERVIVRRQRTRWGSCSVRGTISLNCCLLFQRREVLRYLMIHELAHTRHMNHSRRFWQCVGEHCAAHRTLDRELLDGWRRVPAWVFGDA
ncbi:MAG TPA: SprT family zinc-dependent metalloprotease [Steroidobacteraceae bacterium]|nr:SprT family zinc-dependent metalloprotease [Steroidobacteraceae bacterium]